MRSLAFAVVSCAIFLGACENSPTTAAQPAPATARSCTPSTAGVFKVLASKRSYYTWGYDVCTGGFGYYQAFEFRSEDQYICWPDMNEYYAGTIGDEVECDWYAG